MKGRTITLTPITDERDYALLAEWKTSAGGVYAYGEQQYLSAPELKEAAQRLGINWLMARTQDDRTVGAVNWQGVSYPGSFMIGTQIADSALWGSGYGMEATALLLEYLFHSRNAHRVEFIAGMFNKAAVQIFCSGIITVEGVMRDYFFLDGGYHDAIMGSLLRDEYYALMKSVNMPPTDIIPAAEKNDSRQLLNEYLARNPNTGPQKR